MSDTTLEQLRQDVRYLMDRSAIVDCIAGHARGHYRHARREGAGMEHHRS